MRRSQSRQIVGPEQGAPAETITGQARNQPLNAYSFAAQFAEVEVDTETGQVRVLRMVAVHDIGKAINPAAAEGQVEGGLHQGIGYALMEDMVIDPRTGRTLNPNFVDYKLLTSLDMPEMEVEFVESGLGDGPYGAKGVAEDSLCPTAPAITNAIYNATGVRITQLPSTPSICSPELQRLRPRRPLRPAAVRRGEVSTHRVQPYHSQEEHMSRKSLFTVLMAFVVSGHDRRLRGPRCAARPRPRPPGACRRTDEGPRRPQRRAFKMGLLSPGSVNDQGWNTMAYNALKQVEKDLGAEVSYVELKQDPASYEKAFRDFAAQGYQLDPGPRQRVRGCGEGDGRRTTRTSSSSSRPAG